MKDVNSTLSLTALNENGLNIPIKGRLTEWIYKNYLTSKVYMRSKVKGWKKTYHTRNNQKRTGAAILIWDKVVLQKVDFKTKIVINNY